MDAKVYREIERVDAVRELLAARFIAKGTDTYKLGAALAGPSSRIFIYLIGWLVLRVTPIDKDSPRFNIYLGDISSGA